MHHRTLSIGCFIFAATLIAVACYFSYRSGCVFDGKTGTGDVAAAEQFDLPGLISICVSGLFFSVGASLVPARFSWFALLNGFLAFVLFILPLSAFLMFGTASEGVMHCNPAVSEP